MVNSLKIHEDVICIDISNNSSSKLEEEVLIPIIEKVGYNFQSHKQIVFLKDMCSECELTNTLKFVKHLQANARNIIQNNNKRDNPNYDNKVAVTKQNAPINSVKNVLNNSAEKTSMKTEAFPVNPHLINNQSQNNENVKLLKSINEHNIGVNMVQKEKNPFPKNVRYKNFFLNFYRNVR